VEEEESNATRNKNTTPFVAEERANLLKREADLFCEKTFLLFSRIWVVDVLEEPPVEHLAMCGT